MSRVLVLPPAGLYARRGAAVTGYGLLSPRGLRPRRAPAPLLHRRDRRARADGADAVGRLEALHLFRQHPRRAAARPRDLGLRAGLRALEPAAAPARLDRGRTSREAIVRALGPPHAARPAHQQDLRDAAADRRASPRARPRGQLRAGGDRRVSVAGIVGSRLRDVKYAGRGGGENRTQALQHLHPERRQPDDGLSPRRARGARDLSRNDAGAGDEDDRVRRSISTGAGHGLSTRSRRSAARLRKRVFKVSSAR